MIKPIVNFELQLQGDGTATTASVSLATAPISFIAAGDLAPTFSLGSYSITGVENLSCSDSTVTVTGSILLGMLDLTFSSALSTSVQYTVAGTFLF